MALNIKNREVESLAAEVAELTGESKTEAVRRALEERLLRLERRRLVKPSDFFAHLEHAVWPQLPSSKATRLSREERDALLGYGPDGI